MEEDDEFEDDVPQTPSRPSWTTFCQDPDAEEDWPEELEGYEEEDF